ncbi:hypothetical protein RSal33209_2265 [Renibacterium salmoninarum ATCC 33209]|uniref:Uncharacterized protein n=1 Tax=Renibacterium salmoninarum (strain ATCC 33209 / DSM 20767 / JCM 11484 / NBRC 15589 / NCIMB 2235) TaxID=288705 RepID=A9WT58_RENSM|nr:hypothetical protein [Renibacterium salmoninarum]ABY23996.1 hypothetical protein RSal33209_2265 [Renibacterium salmoninarum ATCC 33209]
MARSYGPEDAAVKDGDFFGLSASLSVFRLLRMTPNLRLPAVFITEHYQDLLSVNGRWRHSSEARTVLAEQQVSSRGKYAKSVGVKHRLHWWRTKNHWNPGTLGQEF